MIIKQLDYTYSMAKKRTMDPQVSQHQKLVSQLKQWINPAIALVESWYGSSITLTIPNLSIVIIPQASERACVTNLYTKIIFDPNYKFLKKIINQQNFKRDYENGSEVLFHILQALKRLTQSEAETAYEHIHDYALKQALIRHYHLNQDPNKEFFLFGDDEFRPRYTDFQPPLKVPSEGLKVKIQDKSALLFTRENGSQYLDLDIGMFYKDDTYIYLNSKIVQMVKCSKAESTTVSYNSKTKSKIYRKLELKPGIDLTHEKKIRYQSANGREFTLKLNHQTYFLEDDQGTKVDLSHPDLLVYIQG